MQLYYIRHGQSVNNALWLQSGSDQGRVEDPELTEKGILQANALADLLAEGNPQGGRVCDHAHRTGFGINYLYSSYMLRAVQTGALIAERLGVPFAGWEDLHEEGGIFLGNPQTGQMNSLPGKSREYFASNYPNFILQENFCDSGWWDCRPVETGEEAAARAQRFLGAILAKHGEIDDRVAIVSHGGFYNRFLNALLDLPPGKHTWFAINNTAITRINFGGGWAEIVYQNRTDHLTPDLIT